MKGKHLDTYQEAYGDYLKQRIEKGLYDTPDACISFVAGYKAAKGNIIKILEAEDCGTTENCHCAISVVGAIALIKEENK